MDPVCLDAKQLISRKFGRSLPGNHWSLDSQLRQCNREATEDS